MRFLFTNSTHRRHGWGPFTTAFLLALCLLGGCRGSVSNGGTEAATEPEQPKPIAQIGGQPVFAEQFEAYARLRREAVSDIATEDILEDFIGQEVLFQAALRVGVRATDAEVERLLAESEGESPSDPNRTLEAEIRKFLTVQKFIQDNIDAESQVSLGEIQEYYERHADEFIVGDRVSVLEVLVKDRELAGSLRKQLQAGEFRDFREIARRYSVGATAEQGGQLGPFERGDLPKRFEDFIFALKVGEISPIFRSELGYHIFTVEQLTPRHAQKFYEVQGEIFARLVADREREALDAFLKKQMESASIEILDASLKADWSEHHAERLQ